MVKREKANYLIQSVSHAIDVLIEFCGPRSEVGVTELSKSLKLHKNNVFRLLATLELRGLVEQNQDSENYRLGPLALQLGQAYVQHSSLVARAMPLLKNLSERIGETVSLAVLHNGTVQYPVSIESKRPVKVSPRMATSFPAKMNAAGRLLTAQLADAVLAEILATNTPQDAAIKNQLNELRSSGQLIDRGATEADVVSVCRLVRGARNDVIGAVEVLVPQYRAKVETMMPALEEVVQALGTSMGQGRGSSALTSSMEKEVSRPAVDERQFRAD